MAGMHHYGGWPFAVFSVHAVHHPAVAKLCGSILGRWVSDTRTRTWHILNLWPFDDFVIVAIARLFFARELISPLISSRRVLQTPSPMGSLAPSDDDRMPREKEAAQSLMGDAWPCPWRAQLRGKPDWETGLHSIIFGVWLGLTILPKRIFKFSFALPKDTQLPFGRSKVMATKKLLARNTQSHTSSEYGLLNLISPLRRCEKAAALNGWEDAQTGERHSRREEDGCVCSASEYGFRSYMSSRLLILFVFSRDSDGKVERGCRLGAVAGKTTMLEVEYRQRRRTFYKTFLQSSWSGPLRVSLRRRGVETLTWRSAGDELCGLGVNMLRDKAFSMSLGSSGVGISDVGVLIRVYALILDEKKYTARLGSLNF
ncbi:hypothetical protein CCUS01_10751 [Colletotrichum cuscutae]|uniref:Uncharacterized protein n=1 Tax=Colletotrichum cuscutae TaxID=1209917 RepID=A0AAI9U6L7_9PEZI|nr:hypothetical protein CCUS01_10751 [Colletotrichum cuscutae]